jgi:non-ribosomal peptide synthetase component F
VRFGLPQEEHERFFRAMLGDVCEPTLPFGVADVRQGGAGVGEAGGLLPAELGERLRGHARRLGVSVAALCHLAWGQVLARLVDSDRVVFGTVLFGRLQASEGADRAAGLFINTLPLRLDLGDVPVEEAVRRTQSALADLLAHEHASLALAQRCSGIAAPQPLFGSVLNYRHNQVLRADTPDAADYRLLEQVEFLGNRERTNYPITMSVEDYGDRLGLTALVVEPLSAQGLCDYLTQALDSLAQALDSDPAMPVGALEILPEPERAALSAIRTQEFEEFRL